MLRKIKYVLVVVLLLCGVTSFKCEAEESEWTVSNTVTLQKAIFITPDNLTVTIDESSGALAHEYELYLLSEEELEDNMGAFMYNGKNLYIVGIMTVDVNDAQRVVKNGDGTFSIKDQTMYFGDNEIDLVGKTIYVGVESLDESWNSSYSNLLELNVKEGNNEVIFKKGNGNKGNNSNGGGSSNNGGNNSGLFIAGGAALAAIGGSAAYFASRKRKLKSTKKEAKKKVKLSVRDRNVYTWSKNNKLKEALKDRPYLKVKTLEKDEIENAVEESKPDLLIMDIDNKESYQEVMDKRENTLKDCPLGLNVDSGLVKELKAQLDNDLKEKKIVSYAASDDGVYKAVVKLILPILKPDLKSDEALENVGEVADLLGIPGLSTAINAYIAGKDIKENLDESELGVSESASIIGDIASILGLEKVESVAGLVGDVESIKDAFDKEAGANEAKGGISAAKDIVDVVKDITNK